MESSRFPDIDKQPVIELVVLPELEAPLEDATETKILNNKSRPSINVQLATLYYTIFLLGFQDGSLGPLLPVIQRIYHVNFTVVSMIYVFSCLGILAGAMMNVQPGQKLGFGKSTIGAISQGIGCCLLAPEPPFEVIVLAYMIIGFGEALQNVQANAFVAAFGSNTKLGILHASYGTGALIAPLISTQFSQMRQWSLYWLVPLGLAVVNIVLLVWVFRLRHRSDLVDEPVVVTETTHRPGKWKEILSMKAVHALSFFVLVYCGVEVTLGGWIVTFIIDERHGSPSAGYISSGFFGGLMVGRLALLWVNKKIGTRRVIFAYAILAMSLEFIIWFIPNLIGNAVAIAFIGVLMGPMFPLLMNHAHLLIPPSLLSASLGWIVGVGTTGICFLPFIQGALANKFGIGSLQPFMVIMMCILIGLWAVVPKVQRHVE
ncbi:MFS general substrate transporter [Ramaria rubella]|nr:MFS general substrate transporter [Ramaria rubella]